MSIRIIMAALLCMGPAWLAAAEEDAPSSGALAEQVRLLQEQVQALTGTVQELQEELRTQKEKAAALEAAQGETAEQARQAKEAATEAAEKTLDLPTVEAGSSGLRVTSPNGDFQFKIGMRLAHDFAWFRQDEDLRIAVGDEQDGTGFRFARPRIQGRLFEDITFLTEFELAEETGEDAPSWQDVYLQYNGIPYFAGNEFDLRIGHWKEPFNLDELNSISNRTFLENPLIDAIVPSRNTGVMIFDSLFGEPGKERFTWQIGLFKDTDDFPSSNDSDEDQGWAVTTRVSGLPYYAREGRRLIHLGFGYSRRNPDGAPLGYGVRPESRLALFRYIDPDSAPVGFRLLDARADNVDLFGPEFAMNWGPWNVQAEAVHSSIDSTFAGNLDVGGWYAETSFFLTGEHRPYSHGMGYFGTLSPKKNFDWRQPMRGPGAWQIAYRYSTIDLTDGPIRGGEHTSNTVGVNWYLNRNVRVMSHYIMNDIEHPLYDGNFEIFQTRFQFRF